MEEYELLAGRARSILETMPRPFSSKDIALQLLGEIAEEFSISVGQRPQFTVLLSPAVTHIVATTYTQMLKEIREEAARAHSARRVGQSETQPATIPPARLAEESDQTVRETQTAPDSSIPTLEDGQGMRVIHTMGATPQGLEEESQTRFGLHDSRALSPGQDQEATSRATSIRTSPKPDPVLIRRQEIIRSWAPLKDEILHVPEFRGITYANANLAQLQRARTHYHRISGAWLHKARELGSLIGALEAIGCNSLAEALAS